MKKILIIIVFIPSFFGCGNEDSKEKVTSNVPIEQKIIKANEEQLLLRRYRGGAPEDPKSEVNTWCGDAYGNMVNCSTSKIIQKASEGPFILTLKSSNQPVTGIVYGQNTEAAYKNGLLHGLDKWWDSNGNIQHMILYENNEKLAWRKYKNGKLKSTELYENGKRTRTIKH